MKNYTIDTVKTILEYQYSKEGFGFTKSPFTSDIIDIESKKFVRNHLLDSNKTYLLAKHSKNWDIIEVNSVDEVLEYAKHNWAELFLVHLGCITVPIVVDDNLMEDMVGVIFK